MWIYFSARRGGNPPADGRPRAETPAGRWSHSAKRGAGRRECETLLAVERGAVDLARLTIGPAGEAQDRGVIDQPLGDGDGLRG